MIVKLIRVYNVHCASSITITNASSPEDYGEWDNNCKDKGARHSQPVQDQPREEGQRAPEIFTYVTLELALTMLVNIYNIYNIY